MASGDDPGEENTTRGVRTASKLFPDDSRPQSWPSWRKWVYIVLVGYCECLTFLVSMMLAPGVPQVLQEFAPHGTARPLGSFAVTIYILGFCVGPLLLAPLTDLYGRTIIYRVSILCFLLLTVGCALAPNLVSLITLRFFAGCFGGAPMAIGGGVIADMYPPGERDGPMACYSVGTMMGPTLGPVLGGVITGTLGWRWVFWIAAILSGVASIGLFFVLPETHLPTLKRRHDRLGSDRKAWGNPVDLNIRKLARTVGRALMLPARISYHLPVASMLLLIGIFNGIVNMILSSLGSVYQSHYNFPATTAGLSYLGIGVGGLSALAVAKRLKRYLVDKASSKGIAAGPESDLLFMMVVPLITTLGLIGYGWSLQSNTIWLLPIICLFFFGFGYMGTRLSTQIFLVEAVPDYAASALAAHTVASSIGGAVIPLSTFPLYGRLGYGWGNTIIAAATLSLCSIPLLMYVASRKLGDRWILEVQVKYDSASSNPSQTQPD